MAAENTTAVPTLTASQVLHVQLAGIGVEKQRAEQSIAQLTATENELKQRLMSGAPAASAPTVARRARNTNSKAGTTGSPRKKTISESQRKRMSEAATKRWAERKAAQGGTPTTAAPVAAGVEPPAGMQAADTVQ